jgi:hypothetical protein
MVKNNTRFRDSLRPHKLDLMWLWQSRTIPRFWPSSQQSQSWLWALLQIMTIYIHFFFVTDIFGVFWEAEAPLWQEEGFVSSKSVLILRHSNNTKNHNNMHFIVTLIRVYTIILYIIHRAPLSVQACTSNYASTYLVWSAVRHLYGRRPDLCQVYVLLYFLCMASPRPVIRAFELWWLCLLPA